MGGGDLSRPEQLMLEAATGVRRLADDELQVVLAHVARVGLKPTPNVRATGLAGVTWQGRVLGGSDRITAAERHRLEHVVQVQEWRSTHRWATTWTLFAVSSSMTAAECLQADTRGNGNWR